MAAVGAVDPTDARAGSVGGRAATPAALVVRDGFGAIGAPAGRRTASCGCVGWMRAVVISRDRSVAARVPDTAAAVVHAARNRCRRRRRRRRRRPKVCAFVQIRWQKALRDVKTFRLCFAPVLGRIGASAAARPMQWRCARSNLAPNAKVLLLSGFLFACGVHGGCRDGLHGVCTRRGGTVCGVRRRCGGRRGCENFSPGLLTVEKGVIRFRPADLACEQSEQNRHPVAKHNLDIHLASQDGGDGFASLGEPQAPF